MGKSMGGYVRFPRDIFEHPLFAPENGAFTVFHAYADLRARARYTPGRDPATGVVLRRGQLITTRRDLARRWGRGPKLVGDYLQAMVFARWIEREPVSLKARQKGTLVTIVDYDCGSIPLMGAVAAAAPPRE